MDAKKYMLLRRKIAQLEGERELKFIIIYNDIPEQGSMIVCADGINYQNPDEALLEQLLEGTTRTIHLSNE